jgi:prepilin-type N-terminal cleavage/methylation domain-containing protein
MPRKGEQGFTLIEILVVLLIITVLSAIAIPLLVSQRAKAHDTQAKTAARVALGAIEVYHQDHNSYAGADAPALVAIEPALGEAPGLTVSGDADGFTISVESASGGHGGGPFTVKRAGTTTVRGCGAPGHGGCPQSGTW